VTDKPRRDGRIIALFLICFCVLPVALIGTALYPPDSRGGLFLIAIGLSLLLWKCFDIKTS
jgi:hypothetical protein